MTEDEMVGCHCQLNGHEFEHALGYGEGQGGLVCCSLWGCKELDTTEQVNWTDKGHHSQKKIAYETAQWRERIWSTRG